MLRLKTNLKAGLTGCYGDPDNYWCYATEPGEAVSCRANDDQIIAICASGPDNSCMDGGYPAATRIQCKAT